MQVQNPLDMKTILHTAASRGFADHGWLKTHHTFSFANYYNPERMSFGVLRVLNDDEVAAGAGFGTHPHKDMEIISIPLEGSLEHKDSMGTVSVIKEGDIQVMSAGTGVQHSEYNKNKDRAVKFLQIWVFPKSLNLPPRYDQIQIDKNKQHNDFQLIVSPNQDDEGAWIHQDAWFYLANFEVGFHKNYQLKHNGNGVYIFVLKGSLIVNNQNLQMRDGLGVWDTENFSIKANQDSEFLVMEVPLDFPDYLK